MYYVTEKQDLASTRQGEWIEAESLTDAKRKATRGQFFHGTVLTIEDESGSMLAYKHDRRNWVNVKSWADAA